MRRRSWLKATGIALATHFWSRSTMSSAARSSIAPRTFSLFPKQQFRLQDAIVADERIVYLAAVDSKALAYLGAVAFDGRPLWSVALPKGSYLSVGVGDQSDEILVHRMGGYQGHPLSGVYSLFPPASPVALTWLGTVPPEGLARPSFLGHRRIGRISAAGSLEVFGLTTTTAERDSYQLAGSDSNFSSLFATGPDEVGIVNNVTGAFWHVDLAGHSIDPYPPDRAIGPTSPDALGASLTSGTILSIAAAGGHDNAINLLLSPFEADYSARLIQIGLRGAPRLSGTVLLTPAKEAVAYKILQWNTEIAVLFLDGTVAAYPLADFSDIAL